MIATLAALAVLAPPAHPSRAEFYTELAKVEVGWTKDQVEDVLGPPDDTWLASEPHPPMLPDRVDAWCYGTHGRHTFPTRGRVMFAGDKVSSIWGTEFWRPAVSPTVINDAELENALGIMCRWLRRPPYDGLNLGHLVRVANCLMALGTEKAIAALDECCRLDGSFDNPIDDEWMHWVVRLAFESKTEGGVFALPVIGLHGQPSDPKTWPAFPMIEVDGVPIYAADEPFTFGAPERFYSYFVEHKSEWKARTKPYRMPDDPFLIYQKAVTSPQWPYALHVDDSRYADWFRPSQGKILRQILTLVETAYQPELSREQRYFLNGNDWEKYHQEFLALGCRWDDARQMYVRKDGKVLSSEPVLYHSFNHDFSSVPGMEVEVWLERSDPEVVHFSVQVREKGEAKLGPALLVFEDAATGKEFRWDAINNLKFANDRDRTKAEVLADPPHTPRDSNQGISTSLELPLGSKIRAVICIDGKRYEGPVWTP
jgi:hypothetical protein